MKTCRCSDRIFCLVNPKSGGNKGKKVISTLRQAGIQCWDLIQVSKSSAELECLAQCLAACPKTPLVLCGGGDGTNAWALSTLDKARGIAEFDYEFGTIPLGSGNDLCNALGNGNRYPGTKRLVHYINQIAAAPKFTKLDRWNVTATRGGKPVSLQAEELVNYFNIGYGAKIASKFHQAREAKPNTWNSPSKNFCKYAMLSAKYMFCNNRKLNGEVEIYADGELVELPKGTKDIAITNINSMSQGEFYWGTGKSHQGELQSYKKPKMGDGKLEVMCSDGMTNNIKFKFGGHYHRLAQASSIVVKVKRTQAVSWDGESSIMECSKQEPLWFTLSHKGAVVCPLGSNPRGVTTHTPERNGSISSNSSSTEAGAIAGEIC